MRLHVRRGRNVKVRLSRGIVRHFNVACRGGAVNVAENRPAYAGALAKAHLYKAAVKLARHRVLNGSHAAFRPVHGNVVHAALLRHCFQYAAGYGKKARKPLLALRCGHNGYLRFAEPVVQFIERYCVFEFALFLLTLGLFGYAGPYENHRRAGFVAVYHPRMRLHGREHGGKKLYRVRIMLLYIKVQRCAAG